MLCPELDLFMLWHALEIALHLPHSLVDIIIVLVDTGTQVQRCKLHSCSDDVIPEIGTPPGGSRLGN